MVKIVIVYGSTTGNTEIMADMISGRLSGDNTVDMKNSADTVVEELAKYDVVIFGSSTWGDGELQDDMEGFNEEIKTINLNQKKAAVFGPGDTAYPHFCKAVDILEETVKGTGGRIILPSLKIDGDIDDNKDSINEWAENLKKMI